MQKDEVHIRLTELMTRLHGLFGRVHQPEIYYIDVPLLQTGRDLFVVIPKLILKPAKLWPVRLKTGTKQSNPCAWAGAIRRHRIAKSSIEARAAGGVPTRALM